MHGVWSVGNGASAMERRQWSAGNGAPALAGIMERGLQSAQELYIIDT